MRNARLDDSQAGIKISGRNNNLRYADDTTLMAERKTKIMASGPITSWQTEGETMETMTDFIFLGSKITADGERAMKLDTCSLEENLRQTQSGILKSRDITLLTKIRIIKAMVFHLVMDVRVGP